MRDMETYQSDYIDDQFERIQEKYRKKQVLKVLEAYGSRFVLEIGCGIDSIASYYKGWDHFTVVEPSKVFCDKVLQDNGKVKVINDFFENTVELLRNEKFDLIILSSLLHEVENPLLLLESVKQLCDEKTIVHINVPNNESFHVLLGLKIGAISDKGQLSEKALQLQRRRTYSIETLKTFIVDSGFNVIESGSYFMKPFTHSQMIQMIQTNILNETILDGLFDIAEFFPNNGSEIFVNATIKEK